MKKKLAVLLLALLGMAVSSALAQGGYATPAAGTAVTRMSVQLLDSPMRGAQPLMNYWPGVRVQVTRVVNAEYVQVNAGAQPGSLMGYMRADALYYGEAGVRQAQAYQLRFDPDENAAMYCYPDLLAERADVPQYAYFNVIGETDGWLHLMEDGPDTFYAFAPVGNWTGEQETSRPAPYVKTAPLENELSEEEAIAYAKASLLADAVRIDGTDEPLTEALLDSLEPRLRMIWYYDAQELHYIVEFHGAVGAADETHMVAVAEIFMRDGEVLDVSYGNG